MKRLIAMILSLLLVLSFVACEEKAPAETANNDTEQAEAPAEDVAAEEPAEDGAEDEYKDEINIAVMSSPPTLDVPTSGSQLVWDIGQNIFETLYTSDRNYEPQPMLAESYSVNDDFTEYTFVIREGIKFHNGETMTTEDVAASMDHWNQVNSRAKNLFGDGVWEAISDTEVKVTLPAPATDLLVLMSAQTTFPAIMPKEVLDNINEEVGLDTYIGTGPYKFVSWDPDQNIQLVRFEDYQPREEEPSGFAGRREALTEKVTYHFVSDPAARIAGLLSGQFDIIDGVTNENFEELKNVDNVNVFTDEGGTTTLFYNVQEGILSDRAMRQAIQTALDFDAIMQGAYIDPELYSLNPGYMNPNSEQWGSLAGEENYNVADPEKAKELLEEAGYNGETIRILTTPDYQDMYDTCMFISAQLDAIGMNTEILEFDFPTFMEHRMDRSSWDLFVTTNSYQQTPPQLLVLNEEWAGANDPRIEEGKVLIRSAKTMEEASAEWDKLQAFLYEYLSSSAVGQYKDIIAATDKIDNYDFWQAPLVWNVRVKK